MAQIEVEEAIGADPDFLLTTDPTRGKTSLHLHRMDSDEFFKDRSGQGH